MYTMFMLTSALELTREYPLNSPTDIAMTTYVIIDGFLLHVISLSYHGNVVISLLVKMCIQNTIYNVCLKGILKGILNLSQIQSVLFVMNLNV